MLPGPYPESLPQPCRQASPAVLSLLRRQLRSIRISNLLARLSESPQSSDPFFNWGMTHSSHVREIARQAPVLNRTRRGFCLGHLQWQAGGVWMSLCIITVSVLLFGRIEVDPTKKRECQCMSQQHVSRVDSPKRTRPRHIDQPWVNTLRMELMIARQDSHVLAFDKVVGTDGTHVVARFIGVFVPSGFFGRWGSFLASIFGIVAVRWRLG